MSPLNHLADTNNWVASLPDVRGNQYLVLADALEDAVKNGQLAPGARLPTHRELSRRLGMAVSTIGRAYAEATRRGLIEARVGRGTFVRVRDGLSLPQEASAFKRSDNGTAAYGQRTPLDNLYVPLLQHRDVINLSLNYPLDHRYAELLSTGLMDLVEKADIGKLAQYQSPLGRVEDRRAGQAWLAACGVPANADEIVLIPGGQGGLTAILLALCRPGDTVLTESLTWPGMLAVASSLGVRLEPVSMDEGGVMPDAFETACRASKPRLFYTMPTLHNPTTIVASEERRKAIARIARRHNVVLIEDDAYGFLIEQRPPSLRELARDTTVYMTSLSKSVAPALRLGYAVGPRRLMKPILTAIRATSLMISPLITQLATQMIESGAAHESAQYQVQATRRRQAIAARLLDDVDVDDNDVRPSLHRWLRIPDGWRTTDFVMEALARGVAVTPGDAFSVVPGEDPRGVRICVGAVSEEARLIEGLNVLRELIHSDFDHRMPVV